MQGQLVRPERAGEFVEYLARKLNTDLRRVPLLLTTQNNHSADDLKRLAHLVFEAKQSPALFFVRKAVSVLFAHGKTSGVNLESSHSQTHIVPVHDGHSLLRHCRALRIGGKIVDDFVGDLIKKQTNRKHLLRSPALGQATESFRRFSEGKVLRDLKPVLNRLRQSKHGE